MGKVNHFFAAYCRPIVAELFVFALIASAIYVCSVAIEMGYLPRISGFFLFVSFFSACCWRALTNNALLPILPSMALPIMVLNAHTPIYFEPGGLVAGVVCFFVGIHIGVAIGFLVDMLVQRLFYFRTFSN